MLEVRNLTKIYDDGTVALKNISFNVDDTRKAVDELKEKGYPFIPDSKGEIARPFRDCEFAFIHPKKLNGVLAELIDYKWQEFKD